LASLGQQAPQQALKELTALAGVGEAGRGMEQSKIDMTYQDFLDRQNFAGDALGDYAGMLYGFPTEGYRNQSQGFAKPSSFQNLMGLVSTGAKLFGGFKEGGHIAFRSRGGLSGIYYPEELDQAPIPEQKAKPSKKDMIQKYLEQMLTGSSNITEEYSKALKAQADIANIKKKRLEDRGFMDRLGEFAQGVAEGYDPTRPQSMTGSLAAGAKAVKSDDQILQERADIEEQLAKGQIGLAEAKIKLANLNLKTFTALDKLKVDPLKFEAPSVTEIEKLIEGNLGPTTAKTYKQNRTRIYEQAKNNARIIALKLGITDEAKFKQIVIDEAIKLSEGNLPAGTKVTGNIKNQRGQGPGKSASQILQNTST